LPAKKGQKTGKQIKFIALVCANGIAKIHTPGTIKHLAVFQNPFNNYDRKI